MRLVVAVSLAAALVAAAPASSQAEGSIGVGWQSICGARCISVKYVVGSSLQLQGIVGHASLTMDDPTVEYDDGGEDHLGMSVDTSAWMLGGRALLVLNSETNMDIYVGAGVGYLLMSGDFEDQGDEIGLSGSALGLNAVLGIEYRFQGLPNLGFSTEIGAGYALLNDIELDAPPSYSDGTLKPETSVTYSLVAFGMHYYF